MKKSRFSDAQILAVLRQGESGVPVADLCREHGISTATFYNWRSKYGGMGASLMSEMKAMADENRRLKKMYAEMAMQNELLKDALGKSSKAISTPRLRTGWCDWRPRQQHGAGALSSASYICGMCKDLAGTISACGVSTANWS